MADGTPAQNPRDVVLYLIQRLTGGFGSKSSDEFGGGDLSANSGGNTTPAVTVT